MRLLLTLISLTFLATRPGALAAEGSIPTEILPQACEIVVPDTDQRKLCSGALISPNLVVTAAHCVPLTELKKLKGKIQVNCGLHGMRPNGEYAFSETATVIHAQRSTDYGSAEHAPRDDFGFLQLDHSIDGISPLEIPVTFDRFVEQFTIPNPLLASERTLDPKLECRIAGFGLDPATRRPGYRTVDQSPGRTGLKAYVGEDGLAINAFGTQADTPRAGDSGGPFYCRKPDSSQWVLFAVVGDLVDGWRYSRYASTISYRFREQFSAMKARAGGR